MPEMTYGEATLLQAQNKRIAELQTKIERLQKTINAKEGAIKTLQQERDNREMYWRDWNGRAANRAALLEGKIEQLQKCCTQRGARMQILWEWTTDRAAFFKERPEARDWFDEGGVPE